MWCLHIMGFHSGVKKNEIMKISGTAVLFRNFVLVSVSWYILLHPSSLFRVAEYCWFLELWSSPVVIYLNIQLYIGCLNSIYKVINEFWVCLFCYLAYLDVWISLSVCMCMHACVCVYVYILKWLTHSN